MKKADKLRYATWLQSLFQVRDELTPIINSVFEAEASGKPEIKFEAFSEALSKLSFILKRLKIVPELEGTDMKKLRKLKELAQKALTAYIKSCELSKEQLKRPSRFRQSTLMFKVSLANTC